MAARKAEVIITCDASTVQRVLEGLNREMQKTNQRRQELQQKQQQGIRLTKSEEKELQQLVKYENALAEKQQKTTREMKKYGEVMKDLAGSKTKDLKKALNECKRALDNMSAKDPKRQQLVADLKRIQAQIDANTGAIKRQQSAFGSLGTTMKNLFAYAGIFAGFNKLKSLVEGVFRANLKLSDSLANIRKVSGLTTEDINKLYRNISKIDSRNTIETLNNLAYTGAKLGIGQNYGVQGLTGFVKAAEQVQMALGEDMGEKALPELAKMTEVMGLIQKYGVEQAMQKTASSIFQLGATSTATGTNIVEFSKRLYGLANVSNVTADELLGLGSAADAMGLMPEVAATAFNKLFTSLQRNHNLIEKSLNIPKGTIDNLYSAGKTMEAIVLIFEKMKETGNLNALGGVFKDLGSDGARLVNVMATMSDRVDMLKEHLKTSNQAFKEGTAVVNEYMIQNNTAQALMERASNLWAKAFVNPEGVDMVKEFAERWYEVSKSLTQSESSMYSMRLSLEMIATSIATLIQMLPFLIKLIAWFGVFKGISSMVLGFEGLVVSIRAATTAMGGLNAVMKSNWAIAAISAAVAGISLLYDKMNAASEAAERMRKRQAELDVTLKESKKSIDEVTNTLENEKKVIDKSNKSQETRNKLLGQLLQGSYEVYLNYLGIEINKATNLAEAYAAVVKVMRQKKALEEREKFREEVNGETRRNVAQEGSDVFRRGMALGLDGIVINGKKRTLTQWLDMSLMADEKDIAKKVQEALGMTHSRQAITGNLVLNTNGVDWDDYQDLMAAIRRYRATKNTANLNDFYVDEQFRDMVGSFDQERFDEELTKINLRNRGGLTVDKPDKQAIAAAIQAAQERKQAARKELQDLTRESDAIMDEVEEFYRLQETAIEAAVADGKKTREEADKYLSELKIKKNETLAQVRGVLSGKLQFSDEQWALYVKQNLMPIMADQGEWSAELAQTIAKTSINKIARLLKNFNGKWKGTDITSTALLDKIAKGRAGNLREVERERAKVVEEVEKILMQYNFIEQANRSFHADLVALGMMRETYEQYVKRLQEEEKRRRTYNKLRGVDKLINAATNTNGSTLAADHEIGEVTVTARRPVYDYEAALRQQFLSNGVKPYTVNPQDKDQLLLWLKNLVTNYQYDAEMDDWKVLKQDWTKGFPMLDQWIEDIDTYMPEIQKFYFNLINMEEEYYDAQKKDYDRQKKLQETRFRVQGFTDEEKRMDFEIETQGKLKDAGIGQTLSEQLGLDKIADDPEILRIQNRIYWRNKEYEDARDRLQQKLELQEQELNALRQRNATEEEIENLRRKQQTERYGLEQLMQERQTSLLEETSNLTVQVAQQMQKRVDSIKNFVKPVTTFTEAAGRKIGDMVFNMESEEATWKELWRNMALAVGESVIEMGAKYMENYILQKSINRASEAEETEHATIMTMLGISSGSAKTIGTLGWWGIPLIAVISALLMGLLQSALSTKRKDTSTTSKTNTKLVSGMLTYDSGNVGSVLSGSSAEKRHYLGTDGQLYTATEQPALPNGVSVIRKPIATTVNGQPALVGEKGPEIVIGRETSRAIMMNEPGLLHHLMQIDRNRNAAGTYRPYDSGTLGDGSLRDAAATVPDGSPGGYVALDSDTLAALRMLPTVMNALTEQLKKPVYINKYGRGGLIEEVESGLKFNQRYKK